MEIEMEKETSIEPPLSMAGVEGFPRDAAVVAASASGHAEVATRPELRRLAQSFVIAARTGKAFHLAAGQIVRVTCSQGPQVADMIVFNADDQAEELVREESRSGAEIDQCNRESAAVDEGGE
jgi:uncharacterized protein YcgI (DUF1989 family)